MSERTDLLLSIADDELILGWRNSEWTGIAPFLEEDVAFSSIAQNEIGHARALYELAAAELGTTADELAFDRKPEEYRSAPLVELRKLEWARTIARHWLYETADEIRLAALKASDDPEIAGLAAEDGSRGGVPPHARGDVDRPPARDRRGPSRASTKPWTSSGRTRSASSTTSCGPSCGRASRSGSGARSRTSRRSRAAFTKPSSPSCGRR